jgi:hypothetical protein
MRAIRRATSAGWATRASPRSQRTMVCGHVELAGQPSLRRSQCEAPSAEVLACNWRRGRFASATSGGFAEYLGRHLGILLFPLRREWAWAARGFNALVDMGQFHELSGGLSLAALWQKLQTDSHGLFNSRRGTALPRFRRSGCEPVHKTTHRSSTRLFREEPEDEGLGPDSALFAATVVLSVQWSVRSACWCQLPLPEDDR